MDNSGVSRRITAIVVCGSLLILPGCIAPGLTKIGAAEGRAEEIKSWPSVTLDPSHRPRVLIIHTYIDSRTDKPRPFVYFLAETGLFDVYTVKSQDNQPPSVRHFEVKQSSECQKSRTERTEMVALTGWRACAVAVPVNTAPDDGLIFYTDREAPHAYREHPLDPPGGFWTMELSLRHGGKEELVAFDEFIGFVEYRGFFFHPLPEMTIVGPLPPIIGPVFTPSEGPKHRVLGGSVESWRPDPAAFLLATLKLDESTIVPPFALTSEELAREIDRLAAAGDAEATHRALDIVAALPRDPALDPAVARLAANPVTSRQMLIRQPEQHSENIGACEKIGKLLRYRDALIEGCSKSPLAGSQCARLSYPRAWLDGCVGDSKPIWRDHDAAVQHVFVTGLAPEGPTSVGLPSRAWFVEIRVPADRGAIDLVVRHENALILLFTGDVSCIARLTLIEPLSGPATGVFGIDAARVGFSPKWVAWIDSKDPFQGDLADILGRRPEAMLAGGAGRIDLAAALKPPTKPAPCGAAGAPPLPSPTLRDDGILEFKASMVLTALPLLPRDLPAYRHKSGAGRPWATWTDLLYVIRHGAHDEEYRPRYNRLLASDEPELVDYALGWLPSGHGADFAEDRVLAFAFDPGLGQGDLPPARSVLDHLTAWVPPRANGAYAPDVRARAKRRVQDPTLTADQRRIFFRIIISNSEEGRQEGIETLFALKGLAFVDSVIDVGGSWPRIGARIWNDAERDRLIARMSDVPSDRIDEYLGSFTRYPALSDEQRRRIVEQLESRVASASDDQKRHELNRLIADYSPRPGR